MIVVAFALVGGASFWLAMEAVPIRRLVRHLAVDARGITVGAGDVIGWEEVEEVRVETTAAGPYGEDFFLIVRVRGRKPVCIPDHLVPRILERIQELPGFDNEELLRATASAQRASFVCWRAGKTQL